MPDAPAHDVLLSPLGGNRGRNVIVTASAQDFVAALFEDLKADDWEDRLSVMRRLRVGDDGRLELNQPIHRRFHIALFEAHCDQPGRPRFDQQKIASMGMVLRRRSQGVWQCWNKSGKKIFGWQNISDPNADPALGKQGNQHQANAAIRKIIADRQKLAIDDGSEQILPLFSAPPDVCEALGKTILFGVIPVVSSERSDNPGPVVDYANLPQSDSQGIEDHLSEYLKARPPLSMPRAGQRLSRDWNIMDSSALATPDGARLNALGIFLHQMMVELDALGDSSASQALMRLLGEIQLPTQRNSRGEVIARIDAASFVIAAAPILVGGELNRDRMDMPLEWPRVRENLGDKLIKAAQDCLTERHKALVNAPTKFEIAKDQYAVRAFIRAEGHDSCPDKLVWSRTSEYFRVLPWWDGEGPGTAISLPSIGQLKKVKPSVSFSMPPSIANLLKGDMKALGNGDVTEAPGGPSIGWLCSFSIPFITICAFIVLNIFLSLFNIIFSWLLFIKVCIPIPKKEGP